MWWKFVLLTICIRLTSCGIVAPPTEADWWQNSIFYEIFPLSFKDSDGDGQGDFQGIIQELDYLVDIGVTAIWLTPFLESPLESGGYDITNHLEVQKVFGTMDDFKALINASHEKNIKVIMDFVPNHTSIKHPWFKKSQNKSAEYSDYYIWKNATNQEDILRNTSVTPVVPNNWKRICGDDTDNSAWIWDDTRMQFYFTQFAKNIPDLNYRNKKVHEEMENVLKFWLELGLDGIRIDALKHVYESEIMDDEPVNDPSKQVNYFNLNHIYTADQDEIYDLIKVWRAILDEYKHKKGTTRIIMTESYSSNDILFKYYMSGAQIPTNFKLMETHNLNPIDYDDAIQNWITGMPKGETFNNVLQNHDKKRVSSYFGFEFIDCLNALTLFLPGVAIVLYGGEIGMEDIDDDINFSRSPMQWKNLKHAGFTNNKEQGPWIKVHSNYVTKNVQTELSDPKSYLNFFKSVSRLRHTETLKRGGLATYIYNEKVFVLNRFLPGNENYTLVINMDSNIQHVRLSDQLLNLYGRNLTVVIGSGNSTFNSGDNISAESLTLIPGAAVIFTDNASSQPKTTESTVSSSTQLSTAFNVFLLCLCIIKFLES